MYDKPFVEARLRNKTGLKCFPRNIDTQSVVWKLIKRKVVETAC